jgi:hypothetical protein
MSSTVMSRRVALVRADVSEESHCEECRLLGYKNAVHTSQETHYISATKPNQLMLCMI